MAETVELAGTRLRCPAHVCAFFSSQEAEEAVYLPFIKAGIAAGEKCVHILDQERSDEKRAKLGALGIDIAAAEDIGQLELRPWEHAHVVGGHFNQARMLDGLDRAAASGGNAFGCTRLWSNQEWSLKDIPGVEDILEYEARFNYIWPKYNDVFVCVYVSRLGAVSHQQVGRIECRVQQQLAVRDLHLCDRSGDAEAERQTLEEGSCSR